MPDRAGPTTPPILTYFELPPESFGQGDLRWLRSIRDGVLLIALAGVLSIWWPENTVGFDFDSYYLTFIANSLPQVVPLTVGWYGAWALMRHPKAPRLWATVW